MDRMLSSLLFIVMRKIAEETGDAIVWWNEQKLMNLNYADDILLIAEKTDETHKVLDCSVKTRNKVRLKL